MVAASRSVSGPRRHLRHLRRLCVIAVVGYGVFLILVVSHLTDRLILFPTTNPIDATRLTRLEAPLPSGGKIEIFTARSAAAWKSEPKAYVLTFTGNAARAELTAPYFAKDWA